PSTAHRLVPRLQAPEWPGLSAASARAGCSRTRTPSSTRIGDTPLSWPTFDARVRTSVTTLTPHASTRVLNRRISHVRHKAQRRQQAPVSQDLESTLLVCAEDQLGWRTEQCGDDAVMASQTANGAGIAIDVCHDLDGAIDHRQFRCD